MDRGAWWAIVHGVIKRHSWATEHEYNPYNILRTSPLCHHLEQTNPETASSPNLQVRVSTYAFGWRGRSWVPSNTLVSNTHSLSHSSWCLEPLIPLFRSMSSPSENVSFISSTCSTPRHVSAFLPVISWSKPPQFPGYQWLPNCGGGNGNPLHYSCLENPMDRGVWL